MTKELNANGKFTPIEVFIAKAQNMHGNKYDYSKVQYRTLKDKVTIICPVHGEFQQTPKLHIACAAIETLPPDLRMLRYLYLFNCWSNAQPPRDDSLSTEHLYVYSKIYNLPHHQRVLDENPEYLL